MYKLRTKKTSRVDAISVRAFKYFFDNCKFYLLLICTSPLHTHTHFYLVTYRHRNTLFLLHSAYGN